MAMGGLDGVNPWRKKKGAKGVNYQILKMKRRHVRLPAKIHETGGGIWSGIPMRRGGAAGAEVLVVLRVERQAGVGGGGFAQGIDDRCR